MRPSLLPFGALNEASPLTICVLAEFVVLIFEEFNIEQSIDIADSLISKVVRISSRMFAPRHLAGTF